MKYFSNINPDLMAQMPDGAGMVLEVGCGNGNFGRAYLNSNPAAKYFGVEMFEVAAREASASLHHVVIGDIESPEVLDKIDDARRAELFDVIVFGDVLEHLRDPWCVLANLRQRAAPGAICVACIPNVSHWSLLVEQLRGRWEYLDSGLLDRTHLRFFTLGSAVESLKRTGWEPIDARPRLLWPDKTRAAIELFKPLCPSLGISTAELERNLSAFQWVIRAVNNL
ncbi:MAG: class I SAM-dependent methyltransferase [Betaproteobacteria bacterium]|jgi:SAM-dependent methyltransferase|nr:class I SAM-dependent methyltransferase [Betaproteobacteria bacterium]